MTRALNPHMCAECGFGAKGAAALASHHRGDRCRTGRARRVHTAAGLVPMNLKYRSTLQAAGVVLVDDFTKYVEGASDGNGGWTPARAEKGCWVEQEIGFAFKWLKFWGSSMDPPLGFTEEIRMTAKLANDTGLRRAWMVLNTLLQQQYDPAIPPPRPPVRLDRHGREKEAVDKAVNVGIMIRDLFDKWVPE